VHVEDHEIGRRLLELLDPLDAVARLDDLAVGVLQEQRDKLADVFVVIDDKREGQPDAPSTGLRGMSGW
jgi:hypothetical protein